MEHSLSDISIWLRKRAVAPNILHGRKRDMVRLPLLLFAVLTTVFVAVFAAAPAVNAQAQSRPRDSDPPQTTVLQAGFERDVNRYRWTAGLDSRLDLGGWNLMLSDRYRSDAFLLFDDRLSFRDENKFRFDARQQQDGQGGEFVVFGTADWYSLSRVFRQDVWGGYRFRPTSRIWIEPAVGFSTDARPGFGANAATVPVRTDFGPSAGLRFAMPMADLGGYLTEASGIAQIQRTAPRTGRMLRSNLASSRTFERTSIRTRVSGSSVRRDAYQAASFLNRDDSSGRQTETVESTRSDTVMVGLDVESRLARPFIVTGSLDVSANSRRVQTLRAPESALFFDSDFDRRTVEATFAGRWEKDEVRARLAFTAGVETERRRLRNADDLPAAQAVQKLNLLRQADNERGYFSFQGTVNMMPLRWWSIMFDGSANILRHDTPEVNPDDRDELLYNGVMGSRIQIRDGLDVTLQVFGSWFHTVYLKSIRSAENSVQRSLRYRPSIRWSPTRDTRLRLSSEVRATYTVDDFLLPGRRPTDQAAREIRYDFEGDHNFGDGLRLRITASISDLQLGRFLDDVFAEIPFDTLRTYSGWARVQTGGKVSAEIGMRLFIRTGFDRSSTIRYIIPESGEEAAVTRQGRQRIDQIGPTMAVSWPMRHNAYLRVDGWATLQRVSYTLYGDLPEGRESLIRKAASKGRTTMIPNLSVTMQWGF